MKEKEVSERKVHFNKIQITWNSGEQFTILSAKWMHLHFHSAKIELNKKLISHMMAQLESTDGSIDYYFYFVTKCKCSHCLIINEDDMVVNVSICLT